MKSLKSYLYCYPVTARFFSIRTDLLCRYCLPALLDMLSLDVLSFTMLSLVTYLISPPDMLLPDHATTWHLSLLWYHLSPASYHVNTWPV